MSEELPRVSVVVPAYNHELFVKSALESVAAQTYRGPLELVVVDDASSDATARIIAESLESIGSRRPFSAIRFLPSTVNRGAHHSLTTGLATATGEYLTILNSDDVFMPTRIEQLVECVRSSRGELAFTHVQAIDERGDELAADPVVSRIRSVIRDLVPLFPCLEFAFLHSQLAISTGNMFFSRELYERIGGFSDFKYVHDWDFALSAMLITEPQMIPERLYAYRLHGRNAFKGLGDLAAVETEAIMRRYFERVRRGDVHNEMAPTPENWPGVFEDQVRSLGLDACWEDTNAPRTGSSAT